MEELIEKLEELKNIILEEDVVKRYLVAKDAVLQDDLVKDKILEYEKTKDDKLKEEIYQIPSFLAYKECENELLLEIMKMNSLFKKIKSDI